MIDCKCGGKTKITNSRSYTGNTTRRHHKCLACGSVFSTIEAIENKNVYLELEELKQKLEQIHKLSELQNK